MRYTYDGSGRVTEVDQGSVASASDADWGNFTILARQLIYYDSAERVTRANVGAPNAPAESSVTQYAYDNANRLLCTAARMNAANNFAGAAASACTAGALGPQRP